MTSRRIDLDDMRIHYLEWGDAGAPPLVLLHGIARCAHAFDHLAPHFADRYRVLSIDLRGHGDSGRDAGGNYLVEDYVRDVEGLIDRLGLKDVVLWGTSTGGRVAQMIAGRRPELVRAVIVEDVGPERPKEISNRRANRMGLEENGWASREELLAKVRTDNPRWLESVARNLVEHAAREREDGRVVWKRDPAILKGFVPTELWDTVKKIRAPIVYILGGASTIVPQHTQDELKAALPQVEIVTMPGLGHYPSDEDPAGFLEIVDEFLARQNQKH
ncbi:MAG TPA: alpha/beta hydrolase [Burkholderiales bacterium]|nr:alpha/beta hydrolase [Burkholderiales bacterium]